MRHDDNDDLSPFRDDPIFAALTAPGSAAELAGGAEALASFRAMNASRPRRRFAARIGASGTIAFAAVALSGGAAAAYTASLPEPVQQTLHEALGPIGVPAPAPARHSHSGGSQVAAPKSPAPVPMPSATSGAAPGTAGAGTPSPGSSAIPAASGSPTSTPVVTPTVPVAVTSPTASPTPTSTRGPSLVGATLIVTSENVTKIMAGSTVTVTGQLDGVDGTPLEGRHVSLLERVDGASNWTRLPTAEVTSSTGTVIFTTSPIDQNVRLELRSHRHVHSSAVKVVVQPTIAQTVAPSPTDPGMEIVSVTVMGAEQGDTVKLSWFAGRQRHRQALLGESGAATIEVPMPKHRTVTYRLFLPHTEAHAAAVGEQFDIAPAE